MPLDISIILVTYNCGNLISASIRSVLSQSYPHFELVIIDDGSEDDTAKIVSEMNDPRIQYIQKEHTGYSASLNYGINSSKYDWIAFQDSDDIWIPDKLTCQVKLIQEGYNFIVCKAAYFKYKKIQYKIDLPKSSNRLKNIWILHGHIATSGLLLHKNLLKNDKGFDESLKLAADYDLFLKTINQIQIGLINHFGVLVRIRKDSMSRVNALDKNKTIYSIQERYIKSLFDYLEITNPRARIKILGWREWFYGDKNKSRQLWRTQPFLLFNIKILCAYLLSFLPIEWLLKIQSKNIRYRFEYLFVGKKTKILLNDILSDYV